MTDDHITIAGIVRDGKLRYPPEQIQKFREFIERYKDGDVFTLTAEKVPGPEKTYRQVKVHYGLVIKSWMEQRYDQGCPYIELWNSRQERIKLPLTKEVCEAVLYAHCAPRDSEGNIITLSQMSVEQASKFFFDCSVFLYEFQNVIIPLPSRPVAGFDDVRLQQQEAGV